MPSAPTSLTLAAAELEHLRAGAASLGVVLDDDALVRFRDYAGLLDRWRKATNLISCASPRELIDRHLLDALACGVLTRGAESVADFGSGAGLPGVPLAIATPSRRTVLLEPRQRRAAFLRAVRRVLGLAGVDVVEARAEDFPSVGIACVDIGVCRAVWSDDVGLRAVAPWIRPGGLFLVMRSAGHAFPPLPHDAEFAREPPTMYRIGAEPVRRIEAFRKYR